MRVLALPALAMMQRALSTPAALFDDLAASRPDASVRVLQSTGYWTPGIGAGTYIADALADEGMLAAHPRFVFRAADGRIFRLVAVDGAISAEQGGARGDGITDDQPALQAAIDYAHKIGASLLQLTRARYRLHCPVRTSPIDDLDAFDGRPLVVSASLTLRGCTAERSVLDFRGVDGADPETSWQTAPTSANNASPALWRGGGIFLAGDRVDPKPAPRTIARFRLERIVLQGNRHRTGNYVWPANPVTGDGWDVTDKALWLQDCYAGAIECIDTDLIGWKGEILYTGGANDALERLRLERCRLLTTNGSALNAQVNCDLLAIDCEFGDAMQAQEEMGKLRATFRNCLWRDCESTGIGSGPTAEILYNYTYPTRSNTGPLPMTVLDGCTFQSCGLLRIASWTRGHITAIDTKVFIDGSQAKALRDVDVTIDSWIDRAPSFHALAFYGVTSLTEPVTGAPAGIYRQPPRNVRIALRHWRSDFAISEGRHSFGVEWLGYIAANCRITVEGSHGHARTPNGGSNPLSFPYVEWRGGEPTSWHVPHGWYPMTALSSSGVVAPSGPVQTLALTGAIDIAVTLPAAPSAGSAYGYAEGQRVRFAKSGAQGTIAFTKGASSVMAMTATRTLALADDWIEFTFNRTRGRWEESGFFSAA